MSIIKKTVVKRTRVSLQQRVEESLLTGKATTLTFIMEDGSKTQQPIKDSFLEGKNVNQIVSDLFALQHDLGAKYFSF